MKRRELLVGGAALSLTSCAGRPQGLAGPEPQARSSPSVFDFGAVGDGIADDAAAFNAALAWAEANTRTVKVPGFKYSVADTIDLTTTGDRTAPWGLLGEGATIMSKITDPEKDVIHIHSRHVTRYLNISGIAIRGNNRRERNGIRLYCPRNTPPPVGYLYNVNLLNLSIERCGGNGIALEGDVFETQIMDSYFRGNGGNGALFSHLDGGICSAIGVYGSVFGDNRENGIALLNNTTSIQMHGGYVLENWKYGIYLSNGTSLGGVINGVGFENNYMSQGVDLDGAHVYANTRINLTNCRGYTQKGGSKYLVKGYFVDLCRLDTCTAGDGAAASGKTKLALIDGTSGGHVVLQNCQGDIEKRAGSAATWEAHNCKGAGLDVKGVTRG